MVADFHIHTSASDAELFTLALRAAADALGLRFTRGSDAHGPVDLDRAYGKPPA